MKNFKQEEFNCGCGCGKTITDSIFLSKLDEARDIAGIPFKITSAYRCSKHNIAVGGVPDSAHCRGLAVDISTPNSGFKYSVIKALLSVGINRIGVSGRFVHADIDATKPANVIWTY